MSEKQPISADQKRGREEIMAVWAANRNCTDAEFQTEKDYYLNVPVVEKTKELIDLELVRSQTAQVRELRKENEAYLNTIPKMQQGLTETKELINKLFPQKD